MNAAIASPPGWGLRIFGLLTALVGLLLALPGVYLVTLGGSWYYALAGAGLVMSGLGYFRGRPFGAVAFALAFAGTLFWAFWEAGLDLWPLVPRLVAPMVLTIPAALLAPSLAGGRGRRAAAGVAMALAVGVVGFFWGHVHTAERRAP